MTSPPEAVAYPPALVDREEIASLINVLTARGYDVIGPRLQDGAIVYASVSGLEDLPEGWTDLQQPGHYALLRRPDRALFGFVVGPHSWKQYLRPSRETLWTATRDGAGFTVTLPEAAARPLAFLGVRACELQAIQIQDRVLRDGPYADEAYRRRRDRALIIAVNCGEAGGTCFCASMHTGPRAGPGFDLALTELLDETRHEFLVEIGSETGAELVAALVHRPASKSEQEAAAAVVARAEHAMGRTLETDGLQQLLQANPEHPRWDDVAGRCLSCGNCTMVCPTCFCTSVEDHSDMMQNSAERVRTWDSCFTMDFSYLHGGSVRQTARARYRQWMTHKLASWIDQFGTSGCVGCGRCITWCPVGIDITEEAAAMRAAVISAEEP